MAELLEELAIRRLRERWAFARDYGDWAELEACFHRDATIDIAWYSGDVTGFIEGSKRSAAKLRPEERVKHWIGNARVFINGNRAVAEVDAGILTRSYLENHLFDFSTRARFFDFVEKREGQWRILQWQMIYDADRMDPVYPGTVPPEFIASVELSPYPNACAFLCYRLARSGRHVSPTIVCINSNEEVVLKERGRRWLASGAAN